MTNKDKGHKNEIAVESFSFGANQMATRDAATGQASGKRQHQPILIRKEVDKSSPKLAEALAKKTTLKSVEIGDEY